MLNLGGYRTTEVKIFRVQKKVMAVSERPGSLAKLQGQSVKSNKQVRAASAFVHAMTHTRDSCKQTAFHSRFSSFFPYLTKFIMIS